MNSPHESSRKNSANSWHNTDIEVLVKALIPTNRPVKTPRHRKKPSAGTPQAVDAAFNCVVSRLIPDLQRHLDTLVGKDFGVQFNSELSKAVSRLLKRLGCSLECPHCHEPAYLRYTSFDKHRGPQFKYEHSPQKRHGGTKAISPLKLIPVPMIWGKKS